MPDSEDQIPLIATLNEPVRGALYRYVVERGGDVTRDQAAEAVGVSRSLAAFHLDRLADDGLLDVSFQRLGGKTGPGAGRPSKLYTRSARQVDISLPPRSYELAARLLSTAVAGVGSPEVVDGLSAVALSFGQSLGEEARSQVGPEATAEELLTAAENLLAAHGYEPYREPGGAIRMRNCPFHAIAADHRELICGMNLSLMTGVVDGMQASRIEPVLDPQPGKCCVLFRPVQD